jgi:hypothetical protein
MLPDLVATAIKRIERLQGWGYSDALHGRVTPVDRFRKPSTRNRIPWTRRLREAGRRLQPASIASTPPTVLPESRV